MPAPLKDSSQSEELLKNLPIEVKSKNSLTAYINEVVGKNTRKSEEEAASRSFELLKEQTEKRISQL